MEIIVIIAYVIMLVGEFLLECLFWVGLMIAGLIMGLIESIIEARKAKKNKNSEEN